MTREFTKRVEDDTVIYENEEAKWEFSKGRPPHIDDYVVCVTVVDKRINVPVMMYMNGTSFRELLRDMGIKVVPPLK